RTMTALASLGKKLVGVVGKAADIPGLGVATAVVDAWDWVVDKKIEEVRDQARSLLGCTHIEVCPTRFGNTPITNMIDFAKDKKGMAFMYEGFALCHPQADFDVKLLSTDVIRWDGSNFTRGSGNLPPQPCLLCTNAQNLGRARREFEP